MRLSALLQGDAVTLSYEVFPPKATADLESVREAAYAVAQQKPSYMSVTYGAGGSTRGSTLEIARGIQDGFGVTTIAHLTCVGATKESIHDALTDMRDAGIENVLALRGDKPKDLVGEPFTDYHYASELAADIRAFGGMCIGGACYPEGHPESANTHRDIEDLKKKVDAGCEYLTTQMFFDNNIYYNFLCRVREAGIDVPVIPGIMPITRAAQLRTSVRLSGSNVPMRFRSIVDRFGGDPEAMQQAGIIYATDQIIDLIANGVKHIHVYSMNKPEVVKGIQANLAKIIKTGM